MHQVSVLTASSNPDDEGGVSRPGGTARRPATSSYISPEGRGVPAERIEQREGERDGEEADFAPPQQGRGARPAPRIRTTAQDAANRFSPTFCARNKAGRAHVCRASPALGGPPRNPHWGSAAPKQVGEHQHQQVGRMQRAAPGILDSRSSAGCCRRRSRAESTSGTSANATAVNAAGPSRAAASALGCARGPAPDPSSQYAITKKRDHIEPEHGRPGRAPMASRARSTHAGRQCGF